MARKYSVKAGPRRGPVYEFYNIMDLTGNNLWILYKEVTVEKLFISCLLRTSHVGDIRDAFGEVVTALWLFLMFVAPMDISCCLAGTRFIGKDGILGTIGNGLVLAMFLRFRGLITPTSLLLINLAVSDLGLILLGFPFSASSSFAGRYRCPCSFKTMPQHINCSDWRMMTSRSTTMDKAFSIGERFGKREDQGKIRSFFTSMKVHTIPSTCDRVLPC
ncbi:visual pigment-like receptor peropsin [Trichonephila clavipes]|nr:visual pigment-like receptor peropsin [Trichonephila clavipes]